MPRTTTAPAIVEHAYDLWRWLDPHLVGAPATTRATLGRHVTDAAIELLDLLLQTVYEPRGSAETAAILRRAAQRATLLRYLLRAMRNSRVLSLELHAPGDELFAPLARRVGLPLGSLTSQRWANRYLDPVDHLVKDRLRTRAYLRYMDDMLVFHDDRATLETIARAIESACHELRLRLHRWHVQPTAAGVGFVGFRIHADRVRVRATSVARARRRLRWQRGSSGDDVLRLLPGLRAVFGHWRHADSWRLREGTLRELGLFVGDDAPEPAVASPTAPGKTSV
jgi:hypothetical protein